MHWTRAAGAVLTLGGLLAYGVGVVAPYDGAAFSLTAVMLGVTLFAIGGGPS